MTPPCAADFYASKEFSGASRLEQVITNNAPILESLLAHLPSRAILDLYHTSRHLQQFLKSSPSSWRYMSWRHPPSFAQTLGVSPSSSPTRRSSYPLDRLLMYVVLPMSTRLTTLVLDNTTVSGANLFGCVMVTRKDTLQHLSVRGCKNVSLKYHVNPWLAMHVMALDQPLRFRSADYSKLALKSLYTYRCRHHRRRPYLPSSLTRKESDSEPTHDLVTTCHKLGIWTDTAWCTTPGARCYRRRGYVAMRSVQDTREVWVVFDRLWRSRNWLGPTMSARRVHRPRPQQLKRDGRAWDQDEEGYYGEPLGTTNGGKHRPTHERFSHTQFVDGIRCSNCEEPIAERCEQCSVMMHCSGCRKTLCASCAFDRPYLRNKNALPEEKRRFWWAPGSVVSPNSMQDIDPAAPGALNHPSGLPNITMRWCCVEPVFSGGGGVTVNIGPLGDPDRIKAAPLRADLGFKDPEFDHTHDAENDMGYPLCRSSPTGPGGRWWSIQEMFRYAARLATDSYNHTVPRMLCDECYNSAQWKMKCKACAMTLCLKHDVREQQRVRICGYKELSAEKQEMHEKVKASRLLRFALGVRKQQREKTQADRARVASGTITAGPSEADGSVRNALPSVSKPLHVPVRSETPSDSAIPAEGRAFISTTTESPDLPERPQSCGSSSSGLLSRSSSPAPSARSAMTTPEPSSKKHHASPAPTMITDWRGCQAFFCPRDRQVEDHRRRCVAIMRVCVDCKVLVCEDCVSELEHPCGCKGCRLPAGQADGATQGTAAFFCPNCRHSRINTRKCRRNPAYLVKQHVSPSSIPYANSKRPGRLRMSATEKAIHNPDFLSPPSFPASISNTNDPGFTLADFYSSLDHELADYQEIGHSAVQVVRKVQTLRLNAPPGSAAARALPNIIIEGVDFGPLNTTQMQTIPSTSTNMNVDADTSAGTNVDVDASTLVEMTE